MSDNQYKGTTIDPRKGDVVRTPSGCERKVDAIGGGFDTVTCLIGLMSFAPCTLELVKQVKEDRA